LSIDKINKFTVENLVKSQILPSPSRGGTGWGWVLFSRYNFLPHPPPNLPLEGGGNKLVSTHSSTFVFECINNVSHPFGNQAVSIGIHVIIKGEISVGVQFFAQIKNDQVANIIRIGRIFNLFF